MRKIANKQILKFKKRKYIISILLVLFLVVLSLTSPGLLFGIQDHIQVRKTWQGMGNSLDIEVLNDTYEDKKERLAAFAQGLAQGKKYYVSGMEVSLTKEEQYSIMEQILPSYYYSVGCTVVDWKKYIIFDSALVDNNASVAFMTWYIELLGDDENSIKILVDTEDLTVYYIKVDGSIVGDAISSQMYINDEKNQKKFFDYKYNLTEYLFGYLEPDSIEDAATESQTKDFHFAEPYYINMYFGSHPLQWELIFTPYLQAGFPDMRVLIPELEE